MSTAKSGNQTDDVMISTLPGDDIRQIMWRFSDRYDLQMVVQSSRAVARGIVARLVAEGERNSHEWTKRKAELLTAFDEGGITSVIMQPEDGGYIEGPKNFPLALVAFELAWVDGGAATCSLAGNLALAPIHEKGTPEQKSEYMKRCIPPKQGEDRKPFRGAFALTEPLPYVGVDTGIVSGKMRIAEWEEGKEPILQIEKRGRFITNMGFANFVTAAVSSDDKRLRGTCMVILEETDPGLYDRGAATHKLVHQLSSTQDPILNLKVPASRIIGGYTVRNGRIVPNYNHGDVIDAVFRRTRVPVALMSSAKLLSSIEPVIRYQRERYRGSKLAQPGTPRYDLGLQQRADTVQRLVDVWTTGEASTSLGFATARFFDEYDVLEKEKNEFFEKQGAGGLREQIAAMRPYYAQAEEYLQLSAKPEAGRDRKRFEELKSNPAVQFLVKDSLSNVLCPACKLWNTGYGATMMREAVSLMGGYGITEDCPGFLGQKWIDIQLEATYEGPEAVQRQQLSVTMTDKFFLMHFNQWLRELREIAKNHLGIGADALADSMELWLCALEYIKENKDSKGEDLYQGQRQGVSFPLTDALCWILAARYQMLDVLELKAKGSENSMLAEALPGFVNFFTDLCNVQVARTAGEVGQISAKLVFGYNEKDNMPDEKVKDFIELRAKLDASLAGSGMAKDRAAKAISQVMIPEALDYPM